MGLLPETMMTSHMEMRKIFSLKMQQAILRNIVEEIEVKISEKLNGFTIKWSKQWMAQTLCNQKQCSFLHKIDWQRTFDRLMCEELRYYKMSIPTHKKHANIKHKIPLFEGFGRYGFKTIRHSNLAFIASSDHTFEFAGDYYLKQLYHSILADVAIIVLIFDETADCIHAFYLETDCEHEKPQRNDDSDIIFKYLNAPFLPMDES